MRIIPAIDIIDGKCVRLTQGDYGKKRVYNEDPLAVAIDFQDAGIKYLHLVDLDGAKAGRVTNWKVIESITGHTNLTVDFGGGIKTDNDIRSLFDAGVAQVNLGSIAVKDPEKVAGWIQQWGADKIILSADVRNEIISINGWLERSTIHINDFVAGYLDKGIQYVTCTDISTDGMLSGPNLELYSALMKRFPAIKLIASGGVSSMQDLRDLEEINIDGVIIGRAIYEGKITLTDLRTLATNT